MKEGNYAKAVSVTVTVSDIECIGDLCILFVLFIFHKIVSLFTGL